MDRYGLTEEEKKNNVQEYNHALFHNMMFFMDIVWEINMLTGTAYVLEDKANPQRDKQEFLYEDVFQAYYDKQVHESERALFRQYLGFDNLKRLRGEVSLDLQLHTESGGWTTHRIVLTPAFNEAGTLYCVYLGARDMQAEDRRARAEYRNQEQFRDALMANSYFHFDFDLTDGGLIREDFITSRGYRPIQALTGQTLPIHFERFTECWEAICKPQFETPLESRLTVDYLKTLFQRNERLIEINVKQKPPEGSGAPTFMQIYIILMENPQDKHIRACVISRDIGRLRREALESSIELQDSNEQLKRTLSQEEQFRLASLSGAMMVYNINLTKDLIEEEFYEIVDNRRYPMLQMVGLSAPCNFDVFCKRWSERKIPADSRETFLSRFNRKYLLDAYERGEKVVEIEFDTLIGRGIPVTLRNTALLLEDKESGDLLATISGKDVSLQRKEEYRQREALRSAFEAANNANAAKSIFLARMSHDIRTPMNAIIGMTAIASAHLDDRQRVADCLKKISISSQHLLGLINEVLDMSKIESGKLDLLEEAFVLPELINELLVMSRPQLARKNHELSLSIHGIEHEKVMGDKQRIQQVFMNLMSNAIKYTPNGGKIALSITEKSTNKPQVGSYEFIFEDNGIGMSEEFLKKIFEPFSRAEDSRVEKVQGTGLGLSITRNIVHLMNGTIDVKSRLDKGTRVTVTIFLKLQAEQDEANDKAFLGLPVLVVDDDELSCDSTCEILSELGMKGDAAHNGQEAIELAVARQEAGNAYYAVILDWRMPGMDGISTAKELRRRLGESIPMLIISGHDWAGIESDARAAGITAFLSKPVFKSRMASLFHELMGQNVPEDSKSPLEDLSSDDFSAFRALLAEDNDLNAEIAAEILSVSGLKLDRVCNGKEAVERIAAVDDWYYNIVFMDIQMPVMNGYEAAKAIRALDREYAREIPILAMSANAFAEDVQAAKAAGMNEHIAKPLDLGQLDKTLRKWLKKPGR